MQFDARAAKLLKPKEHFTIDGYPALRLVATSNHEDMEVPVQKPRRWENASDKDRPLAEYVSSRCYCGLGRTT
jgi:hypothetical protein